MKIKLLKKKKEERHKEETLFWEVFIKNRQIVIQFERLMTLVLV